MSPFGIETLPAEVLKALRTVPLIAERLREVAVHTSVLAGVREDVERIDARMETVETAMPALAEQLTMLAAAIERLDANLGALQVSMEPVGRLADRLPGSSRKD